MAVFAVEESLCESASVCPTGVRSRRSVPTLRSHRPARAASACRSSARWRQRLARVGGLDEWHVDWTEARKSAPPRSADYPRKRWFFCNAKRRLKVCNCAKRTTWLTCPATPVVTGHAKPTCAPGRVQCVVRPTTLHARILPRTTCEGQWRSLNREPEDRGQGHDKGKHHDPDKAAVMDTVATASLPESERPTTDRLGTEESTEIIGQGSAGGVAVFWFLPEAQEADGLQVVRYLGT